MNLRQVCCRMKNLKIIFALSISFVLLIYILIELVGNPLQLHSSSENNTATTGAAQQKLTSNNAHLLHQEELKKNSEVLKKLRETSSQYWLFTGDISSLHRDEALSSASVANNNNNNKHKSGYERIEENKKLNIYPRTDREEYLSKLHWMSSVEKTFSYHRNNRTSSTPHDPHHQYQPVFFNFSVRRGVFRAECEKVAGDQVMRDIWKNNGRKVCGSDDNRSEIQEYVLDHLELNPSIKWYKNIEVGLFPQGEEDNTDDEENTAAKERSFLSKRKQQRVQEKAAVMFDAEETKRRRKQSHHLPFQILKVDGCNAHNTKFTAENGEKQTPPWIFESSKAAAIVAKNRTQQLTLPSPQPVFITAHRFMPGNSYEQTHAMMNYYLMLHSFHDDLVASSNNKNAQQQRGDFSNVQFLFIDEYESTLRDDQLWASFTLNQRRPVYRYQGTTRDPDLIKKRKSLYEYFGIDDNSDPDDHDENKKKMKDSDSNNNNNNNNNKPAKGKKNKKKLITKIENLIEGPSTGISVLVSNSNPLHGRGSPHSCLSSLTQNAAKWMRSNFEKTGDLLPLKSESFNKNSNTHNNIINKRIEVIWCSRSVHPQAGGRLVWPNRVLHKETEFVLALRKALGPDFKLRVVDFGKLDAVESIAAAETAQIMIGFHGAGLVHALFMKPADAAVIELFGDDRSPENRHYANLATFQDLHYNSVSRRWRAETDSLSWWASAGGGSWFNPKTDKLEDGIISSSGFKTLRWDQGLVDIIADKVFRLPWRRQQETEENGDHKSSVIGTMPSTPRTFMGPAKDCKRI